MKEWNKEACTTVMHVLKCCGIFRKNSATFSSLDLSEAGFNSIRLILIQFILWNSIKYVCMNIEYFLYHIANLKTNFVHCMPLNVSIGKRIEALTRRCQPNAVKSNHNTQSLQIVSCHLALHRVFLYHRLDWFRPKVNSHLGKSNREIQTQSDIRTSYSIRIEINKTIQNAGRNYCCE